jgi:hypothetical protein
MMGIYRTITGKEPATSASRSLARQEAHYH